GVGRGVGNLQQAIVDELGGGEVLDDVGKGAGAGGDRQQAVIGQAAEPVAVDRRRLQLQRRPGAAAVGRTFDLDAAAIGRVIVQPTRRSSDLGVGRGVGNLQLAVVDELGNGEVLDDVG